MLCFVCGERTVRMNFLQPPIEGFGGTILWMSVIWCCFSISWKSGGLKSLVAKIIVPFSTNSIV